MEGKSYTTGVNNLLYKGTRYNLEEIIPGDGEIPYKMSVINVNLDATTEVPARNWMYERSLDKHLLGLVLVQQYNLKKGLGMFGYRAEDATKNELQQIHDFGTYIPMDAKSLSREDKMKALSSLMFIVENHDSRVKAWTCVVGSKQRNFDVFHPKTGCSLSLSGM